ncbi:hypothetical protein VPH35_114641 [Triticum aestivum]|uniref:uncharacterized protein n=1 Tax=Triticum aestivum TaxID=4565 RepID=UPI001D001C51|nr:uncharacterized protein LOC123140763 [Triticum aestivum]
MERTTSAEDLTQQLPDDLLANVFRRLRTTSPSLAASRCVCKAWRAIIDGRRLLKDLPSYSLTGIFFHLNGEPLPRYFSPASSSVNIDPLDYVDTGSDAIKCLAITQHCNGLLLLNDGDCKESWVLNPATRQWTHLPTPPPMCTPGMEDVDHVDRYMDFHDRYLVFDPAVSPHYEVFLSKYVPFIPLSDINKLVDPRIQEREWPPSIFVLLVFSSRTTRWEERSFVREGEAAGTIRNMLHVPPSNHWYAAYWQGSLYYRQHGVFMRVNLSNHNYQVIKPPKGSQKYLFGHYLGKSKNGVYCALDHGPKLRIWYLVETGDQIKWVLKCSINDSSYHKTLLGFHPNKETVFVFQRPSKRVMAYHFNSSKTEDFGPLTADRVWLAFPYTLCLMGELSSNKQ